MEYNLPCGDLNNFAEQKLCSFKFLPNLVLIQSACFWQRKRITISRLSSFFKILVLGRHHWRLLIAFLSLFHVADAYVSVSMNELCKVDGIKSLRLSSESAISLLLDTLGNANFGCKVELVAPETHSISLLFTRRKQFREKKTHLTNTDKSKLPKCPLIISFPLPRPDEIKMCLDLCSEDAFKSVEHFTDILPSRVTLEWIPIVRNINEILASEIVVAAVGREREVCSQSNQFVCRSTGYPIYCIDKKLMCDGKRNCPFEGRDEDKELCMSEGILDKDGFGTRENPRSGGGWEFLASEFLKKLSSRETGQLKKFDLSASTEKSMVLWPEEGSINSRDSETLPDVLKHYGPWGYLMLGMLICGTVLMFCGLWECCCHRPKSLVSNAVSPALFIINQGAQQSDIETPSTPGPPRYEELDQPPSYSTLFPSFKASETHLVTSPSNTLPIALPVVRSLSFMRINSSHINSVQDSSNDLNWSLPDQDIFTSTNCLDNSRDNETNLK